MFKKPIYINLLFSALASLLLGSCGNVQDNSTSETFVSNKTDLRFDDQKVNQAVHRALDGKESGGKSLGYQEINMHWNAKEIDKIEKNKMRIYNLEPKGFPVGKNYFLVQRSLYGTLFCDGDLYEVLTPTTLRKRKNGLLLHNYFLSAKDCMLGESVDFLLVSEDKKDYVATHIVPYPIETKGQKDRKISIEMLDRSANFFKVYLKGFEPKEKLKVSSQSCEEVGEFEIEVNEKGELTMRSAPAVIGKSGGVVTMTFTSLSINETLKLNFYWGDLAHKNKGAFKNGST